MDEAYSVNGASLSSARRLLIESFAVGLQMGLRRFRLTKIQSLLSYNHRPNVVNSSTVGTSYMAYTMGTASNAAQYTSDQIE
ncbi:unnamed protein product [Strongylus vulgaris]|uniref:Uncharacterized protein n=1 Tax=Strongylus vulgaris TaxID=40348 RepID=A0A3P7J7B2_STRVU|nr:unnamed protein product [Strongylus vulgaris]